jgi:PII-like signaling protein
VTCALVTIFGAGRRHAPGSREDTGKLEGEGKLLRIFIGESDKHGRKPLYQAIVKMLREEGLVGATVLRGIEGFGATSRLHTARILRLSEDLPIVIEGADTAERIEAIMPKLDEMVTEGMVTMERVEVVSYRAQSTQGDQGA